MSIVFELAYKNDIRNQAEDLQDVLSPEFEALANRISTQVISPICLIACSYPAAEAAYEVIV